MSDSAKILVVDDSKTQRIQMQLLLEQGGYTVDLAEDGQHALERLPASKPDLVLTDLQMPRMNGLELVEAIRESATPIPVILTTSKGSEEIAAEALHRGAASYVPKSQMNQILLQTVGRVLEVSRAEQSQAQLAACITEMNVNVKLPSDTSLIPSVVVRFEKTLKELEICDASQCMQVSMALDEALTNAMIHGNLEVSSDLRQHDNGSAYDKLIQERQQESPYADRRVEIQFQASREEARFVITDEGPGFCPKSLPDPTDPANLDKFSGRGLLLINAFMDAVSFNEKGNQITLIKRPGEDDEEDDDDDDDDDEDI